MSEPPSPSQKKQGNRHLNPLEIIAIHEAVQHGTKVAALALEYKTSLQTIYNALQSVQERRVETSPKDQNNPVKSKRKRIPRIPPEICNEIIELKRKYPAWGIEYLRSRWIQMGKPALAKSTMYKILKNAHLVPSQAIDSAHFLRFEMIRPGQLYQMDIQGKIFLPSLGWVYGFAIIDIFPVLFPSANIFWICVYRMRS